MCQGGIAPGQEERKRIEYRRQPDNTVVRYGVGMQAGPLARARGALVAVVHNNCYHADRKREARKAADTRARESDREPSKGGHEADGDNRGT